MGYAYLIDQILSGRLQPGEEINRRQVAEQLGVSLAPINEAVAQLESEGFVEVMPRRQTRVRLVRREEVRGLLILREAIECQAARMYCGDPVIQNMERLGALAHAIDSSAPGTRENEEAECAFHGALIDLVGAPLLGEHFRRLMQRRFFQMLHIITNWQSQPPMDSHQRLLKELQAKDPNAAEATMRNHLERGREGLLK